MKLNQLVVSVVLAVVVFAAGGVFQAYFGVQAPPLGAALSPDHYYHEFFNSSFTMGGKNFATSSAGTVTYVASSFTDVSLITHTATAALTATLPASSTLSGGFAPKTGDTRTIYLAPVTNNITLAGGTGTDLDTASSTKVCIAGALCRLDFVRKSNTDFEVLFTSGL